MRRKFVIIAGCCAALPAQAAAPAATLKPIYAFPSTGDGAVPWGALTNVKGTLFGTTYDGGANGRGSVFKINSKTGAEKLVYSFKLQPDATNPQAGLLLVGSTLYGVSNQGGKNGTGAVYAIDSVTGAETVLFDLTVAMGGGSGSNLVTDGTYLYGMTSGGGAPGAGFGVVFKVNIKTGAGQTLYAFTDGADGGLPQTGIIYEKGVLYGTTTSGGANGGGTLYAINASTGAETTLYAFTYSTGAGPYGGVIDVGGVLYGSLAYGGTSGDGAIFAYTLAGGGYKTLYNFTGGADGGAPQSQLLNNKGLLYGTTSSFGSSFYGTAFSLNPASGTLTTLGSFTGGAGGSDSLTPLIIVGSSLYGTTTGYNGPAGVYNGTAFSVGLSGGNIKTLHSFTGPNAEPGISPPILIGSTLYGTSGPTGAHPYGTLYSLDPASGAQTTLYSFTGGVDGGGPGGGLVASGTTLYGHTALGGANKTGTLFSFNTASNGFATLASFPATVLPNGPMALGSGILYGATNGGSNVSGTLFSYNIATNTHITLYNFTGGTDGFLPEGVRLAGGVLYGTAEAGGASGGGTLFSFNLATSALTPLHSFTFGTDGGFPIPPPILLGSTLYGGTYYGGNVACYGGSGCGVFYSFNTSTGIFSALHSFGFTGDGGLVDMVSQYKGVVYGGTAVGGLFNGGGTLFSYVPAKGTFNTVYQFQFADDGAFPAGLVGSGGTLYGTSASGEFGFGNVFSLTGF